MPLMCRPAIQSGEFGYERNAARVGGGSNVTSATKWFESLGGLLSHGYAVLHRVQRVPWRGSYQSLKQIPLRDYRRVGPLKPQKYGQALRVAIQMQKDVTPGIQFWHSIPVAQVLAILDDAIHRAHLSLQNGDHDRQRLARRYDK
jgi:hypothetical protein